MKKTAFRRSALSPVVLLAVFAGVMPATAALVTLTSPDNKWRLSSDEFGAHGEGVPGSFAQRDFGTGLTGYSWAASVLLTDGATRQWLGSAGGFGVVNTPTMGAGNVVSDTGAVGNQRTSVFNVPGFANIQVSLTQTVANSGITHQYVITNSGGSPVDLTFMQFHDVDLDGGTFLNDIAFAVPGAVGVSEGGREVYFSPSPVGYAGYLVGTHPPEGGITGNLNLIGFNNFGIPGANLNQFRDVQAGTINGDMDVNGDLRTDNVADVGYLFHNNLNIPAGGSVTLIQQQVAIPEPAAGFLGLLAIGLAARRRRR